MFYVRWFAMNSPLFLDRNLIAARSLIAIPKVSYCNFCFEHQPEDGDATVASDEKVFSNFSEWCTIIWAALLNFSEFVPIFFWWTNWFIKKAFGRSVYCPHVVSLCLESNWQSEVRQLKCDFQTIGYNPTISLDAYVPSRWWSRLPISASWKRTIESIVVTIIRRSLGLQRQT